MPPKKGKGKKEKTPKQQIKELTEQNAELVKQLEINKENLEICQEKLIKVSTSLLKSVDLRAFGLRPDIDVILVPLKTLENMLESLVEKKQVREQSVESRIEELETRVTQMSFDSNRIIKKMAAYENGLQDLLLSNNIDEIKDKIYDLQYIAGKQYESIAISDKNAKKPSEIDGMNQPDNTILMKMRRNEIELNLIAPNNKMHGNTHISKMNNNLKLYLIGELSIEKQSGLDWRLLAVRVGVPQEDIEKWQQSKLDMPAGRVFTFWSSSEGATVRLLHRHLISPEMRCTFLAKRLSDFYDV